MRNILIAAALLICSTVLADPIPCISLNGRAYAPMSEVGMTQAPPQYSRSMCETDFVWVRTVAEAYGGHLQWSGREVELVDWNGHTLYSFLPMPPRDFWRSGRVEEAYPKLIAAVADRVAPHVQPGGHESAMASGRPLSPRDARTAAMINKYLKRETARINAMTRDAEAVLRSDSR